VGNPDSTRWSLIRGAADGRAPDREEFARRYAPVIRAYLGARWRGRNLMREIDDAAQEVFLDCFREGGAFSRVDPELGGGFRAFLYGVVRSVARRTEERIFRRAATEPGGESELGRVESDEEPVSRAFDRAWARSLLRQAAEPQEARARVDVCGLRWTKVGAHGSARQDTPRVGNKRANSEIQTR